MRNYRKHSEIFNKKSEKLQKTQWEMGEKKLSEKLKIKHCEKVQKTQWETEEIKKTEWDTAKKTKWESAAKRVKKV